MIKKNYVLHERNLELYLSLGLKLTKVHSALQFEEKPWLKDYIDFNTKMRKNVKNDFEKDFYKLMNNSIYGKTMENIRKRSNTFLETDPDHFKKLASQPTFKSCKIFHENLAAVQRTKKNINIR